MEFKIGEPCTRPDCLSHTITPCEGCRRIAGGIYDKAESFEIKYDEEVQATFDKYEEYKIYSLPKTIFEYKVISQAELSMDSEFKMRLQVPFYPNFFHRLMQRLILGIYWRKL